MAFVIDKNGEYLPVFGSIEGGGNTEKFIPDGTTITVETDGSGDFTTLSDAISSLTGKWSTGTVTIQLGEGTFTETSNVDINGLKFLIQKLNITGVSNSLTTLSVTGGSLRLYNMPFATVTNMKIIGQGASTGNGFYAENGFVQVNGLIIEGVQTGINLSVNCILQIASTLTIKTATTGILATRLCSVTTFLGSAITFNTMTTAWKVESGSMIVTSTPVTNITYTSVTNKCSQTVGTFNSNGFIGGTLQN